MSRPANRAGGRPAAGGGSAGARGAVLLVLAAALGIILLQAFDTNFDGGAGVINVGSVPVTVGSTGSTVPAATATTTTTPPSSRAPADVVVLVANGTGIKGLGSQTASTLKALGYNTLTAVDATKALDASSVQFAEGYQAEAKAIALTLTLQATAVQALNSPAVPDIQGANVVVLLGADLARTATSTSSP